jgi:trigger factor
MKKNIKAIALAALLAVAVTGCSSSTASDSTTESSETSETKLSMGEFEASDYAKIGDYKKLTVSKSSVEVSDDTIQSQINTLLSNNTTEEEVTDRTDVQDGDIANIDYVGKMDGEEFSGGSATGYDLEIGSNSFIDDFEEQLIGVKVGETVDVEVTFPDPYESNTDYSGKDAVFTVTVNSIKKEVTPEYNDEFVAANTAYSTTTEYEKSIKDSLYDSNLQSAVTDAMIDACEVSDYPESLLEYCKATAVNYYTQMASYYGYTYEEYLEQIGYTEEQFEEALEPSIQEMAKEELAFQLIESAENITADEDSVSAWLEEYAANNSTTVDSIKSNYSDEEIEGYYKKDQVIELLKKTVTVTEDEETTEAETTTAAQ